MKKYIYLLVAFTVTIALNSCTPIPTGGPVSSNVIYKTYNLTTTFTFDENGFTADINNDGVTDFLINSTFVPGSGGEISHTYIAPTTGVEIAVNPPRLPTDTMNYFPVRGFNANEAITSSAIWTTDSVDLLRDALFFPIPSSQVKLMTDNSAFLGLRFKTGVDYHYAWIRIYIKPVTVFDGSTKLSLIESAYNKNVNQQILAGKK